MSRNFETLPVSGHETKAASFSIPDGYANSARAKEVFSEVSGKSDLSEIAKIIKSFNGNLEQSDEELKKLGMLAVLDFNKIMVFSRGDKLFFVLVGVM